MAADLKLEIIPALFSIGYSGNMLWHDPNLAEALPVKDALFVVKDGVARLEPDPDVKLKGGDFEDLKKWDWKDDNVTPDKGTAKITDPKGKNARIVQKVKVKSFRQYHVSVRVKTKEFKAQAEIKVLVNGRPLNYAHLGVKQSQDWNTHHVVFNSLENEEVTIYFGCWGGKTGELWWDDAKLEEAGLLNVVRRDGAPLVVKKENGEQLSEGKDFDKVEDPRMGTIPWKGGYEAWHDPPPIKTSLPNGTKLRVSFYHVITIYDGQVMICPSEPKTVELLKDEAKRMHLAWGADSYFMSHDEIRVLNWDESCSRRKLDAGEIIADNAKTCVKILRYINPKGRIFVWSDMFDPNHNAHKDYYLVRGDLRNSWEGLDKDVIIAVWYYDKRDVSMKWFEERGHEMIIAGYYDSNPENVKNWLDSAKKVSGVVGVIYTTWEHKYDDLEKFAELVKNFK
jgi:hypothetical protein